MSYITYKTSLTSLSRLNKLWWFSIFVPKPDRTATIILIIDLHQCLSVRFILIFQPNVILYQLTTQPDMWKTDAGGAVWSLRGHRQRCSIWWAESENVLYKRTQIVSRRNIWLLDFNRFWFVCIMSFTDCKHTVHIIQYYVITLQSRNNIFTHIC